MLYLLYLRNGFIKKFPLDKRRILLGRSNKCDFFLDEAFVSKEHLEITVHPHWIHIKDLESTNGTFKDLGEIQEAQVKINQWFRIGYLKFFLKEGNASEFVLSKKIQPLLNQISNAIARQDEKTSAALNILYTEPLVEMLQIGFTLQTYGNLFHHAEELLERTLERGCLLLVSQKEKVFKIESQWSYQKKYISEFNRIIKTIGLFQQEYRNQRCNSHYFCSFPVPLINEPMILIYIADISISKEIVNFIESLAVEISVIHSIIDHNQPLHNGEKTDKIPQIVTINTKMLNLLSQCKKIAASNLNVLIEGETGCGKELFGQFIHYHSRRKQGSFIALNCAAIPENLMEVELFGHEKGAFTDAVAQRRGKLELASKGTLVLDEIGDMPLNLQAKLLRTIQEGQFYRVGGNQPIQVDLRIICLTNKNVKELMNKKLFREDLYYRIAHVSLNVPPLRERKEDIVPLIKHFMEIFSSQTGVLIKGFSDRAIKAMEIYDWPGNIREFENEMLKILNLAETNDIIDVDMLKSEIIIYFESNSPGNWTPEMEKSKLLMLLKKHKWNKSLVAKDLNISRTTLYEKFKRYGIE